MNKQQTITSGPWKSVYNSSDTSEAFKDTLYAAQNLIKSGNSWPARPPFIVTQAAGTLGTGGSRMGQCIYEHVANDGTIFRFVFVGGKMYRWDGNTTYTDVTPVGITFDGVSKVFCVTFGDKLIVNGLLDKPFFVPSSGCNATPVVATKIEIDSVPTLWSAWGPPVVYDARLFFVVNGINGLAVGDTIVWSEVANPALGYMQTNYANFWQLFQTDTRGIQALAATELSLVVFRKQSILNITGKTDQSFITNATRESIEGVGTVTPASVCVHDGVVWFLDEQGRQYRYRPGGSPEALWPQLADVVSSAQASGTAATVWGINGGSQTCYHPDLELMLSVSYTTINGGFLTNGAVQIHVFDAASGLYYGTWDVDGSKGIHAMAAVRNNNLRLSLCILGESITPALNSYAASTAGQMWRQRVLGEMNAGVSWADPSNFPNHTVITHHLGRNESAEWIFDRLTLRALGTVSSATSGRTVGLTYYTPRSGSAALYAVMGLYTVTPLTGVQNWSFGNEVGAIWGLGVNARGPWLMAKVSGPSTGQTVPPFTPISVQLRGRTVPANPFIGIGAPGPPGGTIVTDTFNRADSGISLGTADTGQVWTAVDGTWGISGNRAYIPVDGSTKNIAYIDSGAADATVTCTFAKNVIGMGILVRYVDPNNYFLFVRQNTTTVILFRNQANSFTNLGSATPTLIDGDTFAVVMSGSNYTVKQNGIAIISGVSDAFQATATKHGLSNATGVDHTERYEDFLVTVP